MNAKIVSVLAAAGLLFGSATIASAANVKSKNSPGHKMQLYKPVPGHPGASGYAPGHLKKGKIAKRAPMLRNRSTVGSGSFR